MGKAKVMNEGTDITVIACGSCVYQAMQAAQMAAADAGLKVRVLNMHTVMGGLGTAVAEVVAKSGKACVMRMLGHQDEFSTIGLHEDLMSLAKIDANGIADTIAEVMHADFEADDAWDDEF